VVARLGEHPLLALVGASGARKSSVVGAGVLPALKLGFFEEQSRKDPARCKQKVPEARSAAPGR
jgi:hypothetical protein